MAGNEAHRSLTAELRAVTQSAHKALDERPILADLSTGHIEFQRYVTVISAFGRVWRALESKAWATLIDRVPEVSPFEDRRALLLDADIEALCGAVAMNGQVRLPTIATASEAAGALYVLEGSRLGGTLIADRLEKAGRPVGAPGYRFFGSARIGVAERWRRFKTVVDAYPWSTLDRETASETARATFQAISDAVEEAEVDA